MGLKKGDHINETPAQLANLQTFGKIDPELHRLRSSNGGKRAAEVKRERATFRQAAQWLMDLPAFETENEAVEALKAKFPTLTNAQAMTAAVMHRAIIDGDARAYTAIRDTAGEAPSQNVNVNGDIPMEIKITTVD